ncbi:hypothetical protein N9U41_00465 [Acidimicrobiaceae bacterium]|nr:hypothetical protein [Acidimicrobiaceae bacterium]
MASDIENLEDKIKSFLDTLKLKNDFEFKNTIKGNTKNGENLKLGYSCYALKIYYTLGIWNKLNINEQKSWINYINSFQTQASRFPKNSYIDEALLNGYKNFTTYQKLKGLIKTSLSKMNIVDYKGISNQLETAVRAETKQAISTLFQVDAKNERLYGEFEKEHEDIVNFLENLNWSKPWSSGAEYANLCVFNKTQLNDNEKQSKILKSQIKKYLNNDGFYYQGETPSQSQLINGAMKVLSGLKWIDEEIHYPKKLIDYCLLTKVNNDGCDLVDTVFVLYEASSQVDYKRNEVVSYLKDVKEIIYSRFYEDYGGFSYYRNQSQKYYYGLITSNGENYPDIHGTILLTWALSMIFKIEENNKYSWNILKA